MPASLSPDTFSQLQPLEHAASGNARALVAQWLPVLEATLLRDRPKLSRGLARLAKGELDASAAARLQQSIERSADIARQRAAQVYLQGYPENLPIYKSLAELRDAISSSQVVIVAGETGSGKTTQLPRLCLELGRGIYGRIGHTQPRRIAARTVAARLAEETGSGPGGLVGYQHRFAEQYGDLTRILLMTDGSLLAHLNRDPLLREFDTLVIDEAHERSLNIDFLLGVVRRLLPKRPELKVIVTSATIDVQRFADFFGAAPCIQVEGRGFPVETIYLPDILPVGNGNGDEGTSQVAAQEQGELLLQALAFIDSQDDGAAGARDVLVFLPGEREIREASLALRHGNQALDILPLYARLPLAEQQKIFRQQSFQKQGHPHSRRRVVLATNVAETSLTVPGIGYVIDSGQARVSRFSARSKLQRLQVEPVSQASAAQRAGRAGRLSPGMCVRLYSEQDFASRPRYSEPEIQRTQLASVILQMKRLGLGDLEDFPLLDPPGPGLRKAGVAALQELGALAADGKLTQTGRQLALLPLDPHLGRMLLAAAKKSCIEEVLVIASAMAVQDPREFPADKREAARAAHARFARGGSDFLDWLFLWDYYASLRESLGRRKLQPRLQKEFLSASRLREWRDMHRQLRLALRSIGITVRERDVLSQEPGVEKFEQARYESIHKALLAGIPLQAGMLEKPAPAPGAASAGNRGRRSAPRAGDYLGAKGLRFSLWPGSSFAKKKPRWVLAAEIVETSRVFARCVAPIEPAWLATELRHLLRYEIGEPAWHEKRGRVVATRRALLYGLLVHSEKFFPYDRVDPARAREVFLQSALVEQKLTPDRRLLAKADFWQHNIAQLAEVADIEERLRRRDLRASDQALYAFYDARIPAEVHDRVSLSRWLEQCDDASKEALKLHESQVYASGTPESAVQQFPAQLAVAGRRYELAYQFAPGEDIDGVTVKVAQTEAAHLPLWAFEWLVPGMLAEKVEELLKILPKAERKKLLPLAQSAAELCRVVLRDTGFANGSLYEALAQYASAMYRVEMDVNAWRVLANKRLPAYYHMRIEILDERGGVADAGRSHAVMQRDAISRVDRQLEASDSTVGVAEVRRWDFGGLGAQAVDEAGGNAVFYRFLREDEEGRLVPGLCASADEARMHTMRALPRLAMFAMRDRVRYLRKQLCTDARALLPYVKVGTRDELVDDLLRAAIDQACFGDCEEDLPANAEAFEQCLARGAGAIVPNALHLEKILLAALHNYQQLCELLGNKRMLFALQCEDVEAQLGRLVYPGFIQATGARQFEHLPRYLEAASLRLDRLGGRAGQDSEMCEKLAELQRPLHDLLYKYPQAIFCDEQVRAFRWLLEELRVSLFAQQLKTVAPVSIQRVSKAWQAIDLNRYPLLHRD